MARRSLSQQQWQRIRAAQARRLPAAVDGTTLTTAPQVTGQIMVRYGANCAVRAHDGQLYHCTNRQHLGHLVCGDQVLWQLTDNAQGVITALLPRHTVLTRPDYSGRDKPLAANITLMIVVVAPEPPLNRLLLDQYLVTAELLGIAALIVCNKSDLVSAAFTAALAPYSTIGYPVFATSTWQLNTVTPLITALAAHTAILVGQSGVGKSSLISALLPDQAIQIGALSQATGLGRHTTSTATCYQLATGGQLIDSPGVRSFRLQQLTQRELERGFREFAPYLPQCRFNDCQHQVEPECAISAAVAAGQIDAQRLQSFHQLVAQQTAGMNK